MRARVGPRPRRRAGRSSVRMSDRQTGRFNVRAGALLRTAEPLGTLCSDNDSSAKSVPARVALVNHNRQGTLRARFSMSERELRGLALWERRAHESPVRADVAHFRGAPAFPAHRVVALQHVNQPLLQVLHPEQAFPEKTRNFWR